MPDNSARTEGVVRRHLESFVREEGIDAIVEPYSDTATLLTESRLYRGRDDIRGFFTDFVAALPVSAIAQFSLRALRVEGSVAFVTWSAGPGIPLGTDTFIVADDQIVSQTFVMDAVTAVVG